DRFAMVIGEVDDLAVLRREPRQSVAQPLFAIFLLEDKLRAVRGIDERGCKFAVKLHVGAAAARGQRLVAGQRPKPSRDREERPANEDALRQTSRKTSLKSSSALAGSPTSRSSQR